MSPPSPVKSVRNNYIWIGSRWHGPSSDRPVHQIDGPVLDLWKFWARFEIFIFKADKLISYSFVVNHSLNDMNDDGVTVRKVKKDSRWLCNCVLKGLTFIIQRFWKNYNLKKKFWQIGPQSLYSAKINDLRN